ncbi:hypothetical protein AB0D08_18720 [Kitasatospora sp. NPDC048540]|uniref:hypothetical protein n=1 Tax=Kitasatospora sp. NPDC048540 TaxID=3155634 RepID=UPI0033C9860B
MENWPLIPSTAGEFENFFRRAIEAAQEHGDPGGGYGNFAAQQRYRGPGDNGFESFSSEIYSELMQYRMNGGYYASQLLHQAATGSEFISADSASSWLHTAWDVLFNGGDCLDFPTPEGATRLIHEKNTGPRASEQVLRMTIAEAAHAGIGRERAEDHGSASGDSIYIIGHGGPEYGFVAIPNGLKVHIWGEQGKGLQLVNACNAVNSPNSSPTLTLEADGSNLDMPNQILESCTPDEKNDAYDVIYMSPMLDKVVFIDGHESISTSPINGPIALCNSIDRCTSEKHSCTGLFSKINPEKGYTDLHLLACLPTAGESGPLAIADTDYSRDLRDEAIILESLIEVDPDAALMEWNSLSREDRATYRMYNKVRHWDNRNRAMSFISKNGRTAFYQLFAAMPYPDQDAYGNEDIVEECRREIESTLSNMPTDRDRIAYYLKLDKPTRRLLRHTSGKVIQLLARAAEIKARAKPKPSDT